MDKEQKLIERLKQAVDELNQCSSLLAESDIFVYLKMKSRDDNKQSHEIEVANIILHKSLLEKSKNDSN